MATRQEATRPSLTGLPLFEALDRVLYPSLNPALVLGQDISHYCPSLMYGELSGETLQRAFELIEEEVGGLPPAGQGSLLDIGAGIGKQVFCAACLHAWRRCDGVEIYEKRAKMAAHALVRWKEWVVTGKSPPVEEEQEDDEERRGRPPWRPGVDVPRTLDVNFVCADVVELGAEGYEVILLVSAAFTDELMSTIALVLDGLPVGTLAICITKGLPSTKWEVVHKSEREEPWGRAWLIIQKKVEA